MIDEKTIVTLDFDKILETVAGYSFSEKGKERILALRPFSCRIFLYVPMPFDILEPYRRNTPSRSFASMTLRSLRLR